MGSLSPAELAAWVERSCAQQGVSVKVTDARTVEQVRVLLTGQAGRVSGRGPAFQALTVSRQPSRRGTLSAAPTPDGPGRGG